MFRSISVGSDDGFCADTGTLLGSTKRPRPEALAQSTLSTSRYVMLVGGVGTGMQRLFTLSRDAGGRSGRLDLLDVALGLVVASGIEDLQRGSMSDRQPSCKWPGRTSSSFSTYFFWASSLDKPSTFFHASLWGRSRSANRGLPEQCRPNPAFKSDLWVACACGDQIFGGRPR